ncbi:hypothetical protein J2T02_001968 [Chitinophaga terrae (ex Kim and Jung 2007)]|uniref:hypothetical protein n=1 Tax=Chitinophaga terrae (ex Kim and Jung 2007) TaxID=408074 RepID=UPI00278A0940|nr:hypothetical protein [Chitinophaga terrae (ex Kim and Jung 2007)]MDQ0106855.1 hypothetical protein [Chitinophaga terrae (ex Kim and Jung 2007)]
MKQAKFALTAVAVLAVVGGAIAFKSRTAGFQIYTKNAAGQCLVNVPGIYTTTNVGPVVSFATKATAACPVRTATTIAE